MGTFNARDVAILLVFIGILPFVYGWLPVPLVTCLLALTFGSALYIGYRPLLGQVKKGVGRGNNPSPAQQWAESAPDEH